MAPSKRPEVGCYHKAALSSLRRRCFLDIFRVFWPQRRLSWQALRRRKCVIWASVFKRGLQQPHSGRRSRPRDGPRAERGDARWFRHMTERATVPYILPVAWRVPSTRKTVLSNGQTTLGDAHQRHTTHIHPPKGGVCSVSHVNLAARTCMIRMGGLGWAYSLNCWAHNCWAQRAVHDGKSAPPGWCADEERATQKAFLGEKFGQKTFGFYLSDSQ